MAKNSIPAKSVTKPDVSQKLIWGALGIIMLFAAIIRIRILNVPLERDEGEFAYMGQLILQGIPPYKLAYNMKFPGIYYMYAFFMSIFDQSASGIHFGLLIVNLGSILFLFLLVKRLVSNYAALASALVFVLLSICFDVDGFAAHATNFVIFWALAGCLVLFKADTGDKKKYYFWAGILLGTAPLMKQPGFFFPLFGGLFLLVNIFRTRKSGVREPVYKFGLFLIGSVIPLFSMIIVLKLLGVFDRFWFCTVDYAMAAGKQVSLGEGVIRFIMTFTPLWNNFYLIWILAGFGLAALFFHPGLKKNNRIVFILLFFVFSFLSICPGLYFTEHYYITLLPAIALLSGIFLDYLIVIKNKFSEIKHLEFISYGILILVVTISVVNQKEYLFQLSPDKLCKLAYLSNPFNESIEIAKYIDANSKKNDQIAVLGSEPQIYFYARRHAATGYLTTYGLMEIHKYSLAMQKEMIAEIEFNMPQFVVYVNSNLSWTRKPESETYIFNWMEPYIHNNYQLRGVVDIYPDKTIYKWDSDVDNYQAGANTILIFKRNE